MNRHRSSTVYIRRPRRGYRSTVHHAKRRRCHGEVGSVSVEMVTLVFPLTVLMALFAVLCIRVAVTHLDLNGTAAAAARAASLARTPALAHDAAQAAATADLAGHRLTCQPLAVAVDTGDFRRGGQVTVTITCTITTADLVGLGLPGTTRASATSRAVIDTHRSIDGSTP